MKWHDLTEEERHCATIHIFKAITESPSCSFRRLIYNRLELERKHYWDLYHAGGMLITNAMSDAYDISKSQN